jgi:hypothetical protein
MPASPSDDAWSCPPVPVDDGLLRVESVAEFERFVTPLHLRSSVTPRDAYASLLRDFVFEALWPVERDSAAARLCLENNDDTGARYHLKRVVESVKSAAAAFKELEVLTADEAAT